MVRFLYDFDESYVLATIQNVCSFNKSLPSFHTIGNMKLVLSIFRMYFITVPLRMLYNELPRAHHGKLQ